MAAGGGAVGMKLELVVVLMVGIILMIVVGVRGMSLCDMDDAGLDACKPSVRQPPVDPSPDCCEALKGADLTCLCSYKNSAWLPTLGIDPALAMALPPKCHLHMPPSC